VFCSDLRSKWNCWRVIICQSWQNHNAKLEEEDIVGHLWLELSTSKSMWSALCMQFCYAVQLKAVNCSWPLSDHCIRQHPTTILLASSKILLVISDACNCICLVAGVVGCWHGYLSGARCRLAYGPADATATHGLLLQYNLEWFYRSGTG